MEVNQIKAIGNFLATYQNELHYVSNFQLYKQGDIDVEKYTDQYNYSFYNFLIEFRIVRNFEKGSVAQLLKLTTDWIRQSPQNKVDDFANFLKSDKLSHGKVLTSLASKILFLNDPWIIHPMDRLVRNSLKQKTNSYSDYELLLKQYKSNKVQEIDDCLKIVVPLAIIIEKDFNVVLKNLPTIRYNRLVDKMLWTQA